MIAFLKGKIDVTETTLINDTTDELIEVLKGLGYKEKEIKFQSNDTLMILGGFVTDKEPFNDLYRLHNTLAKVSYDIFYNLNQIYVFKRDGNSDVNYFSPVSMFFREERWTIPEMFEKMKEIAEASIRYYLY